MIAKISKGSSGRGLVRYLFGPGKAEITQAFADAHAQIVELAQAARAISARVPLGEARPGSVRLAPERKRIHDAIRMATCNAESALARLLGPHYARADDEARTLLREAFSIPADLQVVGTTAWASPRKCP